MSRGTWRSGRRSLTLDLEPRLAPLRPQLRQLDPDLGDVALLDDTRPNVDMRVPVALQKRPRAPLLLFRSKAAVTTVS